MHPYAEEINRIFEVHGDRATAAAMSKYLRNKFAMYGIKRPERDDLQKKFFAIHGVPNEADLPVILKDLWRFDQRESQLFGVDLIRLLVKKQPAKFIRVIEYLIVQKSWWDTVDMLATSAGLLIKSHPKLTPKLPNKWMTSGNLWLQRSAILYQLKYREKTDWPLLQSYILQVAGSKEFFLEKASGWALREYSKKYPDLVAEFIQNNKLPRLTVREAVKYL